MYVQLPALQQCPAGHSLTGLLQPLSEVFISNNWSCDIPVAPTAISASAIELRVGARHEAGWGGGGAPRSHIFDYNKASWSCWPTSHIRGVVLFLGCSLNCTKAGESVDAHSKNCLMWMLAKEANEMICLHLPVMLVDTMVCRFWYSGWSEIKSDFGRSVILLSFLLHEDYISHWAVRIFFCCFIDKVSNLPFILNTERK